MTAEASTANEADGQARTLQTARPVDPTAGESNAPDWRIWLGMALTFAWLSLGVLYLSDQIGWFGFSRLPADVLGNFLEGAFAPLAFLWLVIGYFLQQKELAQNTNALRMQFREIQRSAEQAVIQTETIAASERHARQEAFLQIAENVRRQMGVVTGLLFLSSQGDGNSSVTDEEISELWKGLNQSDPEIFARRLLSVHAQLDDDPAAQTALFYGTEIRARHSNNIIFTYERLLDRARTVDDDGIICDALENTAGGFIQVLAKYHRERAPDALRDVERTGRHVRIGVPTQ